MNFTAGWIALRGLSWRYCNPVLGEQPPGLYRNAWAMRLLHKEELCFQGSSALT